MTLPVVFRRIARREFDQSASVASLGPLSEFDEWCIERERQIAEAQSMRYVSRDVVGLEITRRLIRRFAASEPYN